MSNAKHTPSPWAHDKKHGFIEGPDGNSVCQMDRFNEANEANGRLIAAAPELLDILKLILGAHDTKNNGAYMGEAVLCRHYADVARAAIAKAES